MLFNFVSRFFLYKPSSNARRNKARRSFLTNKFSFLINFSYGILGGILITTLLVVLFYLKNNGGFTNNKKLISGTTKIYNKKLATNSNIKHNRNKTNKTLSNQLQSANNYDFYNLLSNEKKSNTSTGIKSNTQINSSPTSTQEVTANYYLHLGTFTNLAAADELKAQLILQGFEANIETIKISTQKNSTYKVTLGPFASQSIAVVKKSQLDVAGFKNILIKNI